jgi:hypothetical protein
MFVPNVAAFLANAPKRLSLRPIMGQQGCPNSRRAKMPEQYGSGKRSRDHALCLFRKIGRDHTFVHEHVAGT